MSKQALCGMLKKTVVLPFSNEKYPKPLLVERTKYLILFFKRSFAFVFVVVLWFEAHCKRSSSAIILLFYFNICMSVFMILFCCILFNIAFLLISYWSIRSFFLVLGPFRAKLTSQTVNREKRTIDIKGIFAPDS